MSIRRMMLFTLGGFFKSIISLFKTRVLSDGGNFEAETNLENQLNTLGSDLFDSASLVITPNGVKTSKLYSIKPNDGTGDLSVVRNTSATRIDENGNIVNVPANMARIDYTTGSPSILVEPQRTNLFLRSEEFENSYWVKSLLSLSVTPNTTLSPSGFVNADMITSTANSVDVMVLKLITITSGTAYSISFYAKQNTQRFVYIRLTSNSTSQNYVSTVFDLQDGTVGQTLVGTTSGTLISSNVQYAGNGFYRVSITASINATDGNIGIGFAASKTGNTFDAFGAIKSIIVNSGSIFLWGAQLEAGGNVTSYIPTTTSAVTRNADIISKTGISNLIGQTEGTFYSEIQIFEGGVRFNGIELFGNSGNRIYISKDLNALITVGFQANSISTTVGSFNSSYNKIKIAIRYKSGDSVVYVNGVNVGSRSVTINFTAALTTLNCNVANLINYNLQGRLFSCAVFPAGLTDLQLQKLTTL